MRDQERVMQSGQCKVRVLAVAWEGIDGAVKGGRGAQRTNDSGAEDPEEHAEEEINQRSQKSHLVDGSLGNEVDEETVQTTEEGWEFGSGIVWWRSQNVIIGLRVRIPHHFSPKIQSSARPGSLDWGVQGQAAFAVVVVLTNGSQQPDDLQSRDTSRSSNRYPPTDPGERSRSFSGSSSSGRQPSEVDLNDSRVYDDFSHSRSRESNPVVYQEDEDFQEGISLANALQPVSPSGSPPPAALDASKSKSFGEYETSMRSEQRASPFDPSKWGNNISRRRPRSRQDIAPRRVSDSQSEADTSIPTPDTKVVALPVAPLNTGAVEAEFDIVSESEEGQALTEDATGTTVSQADRDETARPARHSTPSITFSTPSSIKSQSPGARPSPFAQAFRAVTSPQQTPGPGVKFVEPTPLRVSPRSYATPAAQRAYQIIVNTSTRPRFKAATPYRRQRYSMSPSQLQTPGGSSDANGSFVSTASSHDLTIHPRANASFDLISNTQGRLDHGKLQKQLSRMNQVLSKENAELNDQKVSLEEANLKLAEDNEELRNLVQALRQGVELHEAHIDMLESAGPVQEDEKEELYADLDAAEKELETAKRQTEELHTQLTATQKALRDERAAHITSKDEFEARLMEEAAEAEKVLATLNKKILAVEADARSMRRLAESREEEIETLRERLESEDRSEGDKVERAEQRVEELRRAKEKVEDRVVELEQERDSARSKLNAQLSTVQHLESRVERTEFDLKSERLRSKELESELQSARENLLQTTQQLGDVESVLEQTSQELARKHESLSDAKERIAELEERIALEADAQGLKEHVAALEDDLRGVESENQRLERSTKRMESALEDADRRASAFEEEKASFNVKIAVLEREKKDLQELMSQARKSRSVTSSHSVAEAFDGVDQISLIKHEDEIRRLENELDSAYRQIGRLQHELCETPCRKAIQTAKEEKIRILEDQKKELMEQLSSLRRILAEHVSVWEETVSMAGGVGATNKSVRQGSNQSTPAAHRSILSLRGTPKTPRGQVRDVTWADQSSPGISMAARLGPLQQEASMLAHELQAANERLDAKFDDLQKAGNRNVSLTRQLEDARQREIALQTELERLQRREDRLVKNLERCKCGKCGQRFDASGMAKLDGKLGAPNDSMNSATSERPDKKAVALKDAELGKLKAQLQALENEKASLEETARKLNLEAQKTQAKLARAAERDRQTTELLKTVKDEGERQRIRLERERDAAREDVRELERDLRQDRLKLKALESQQTQSTKEVEDVASKLQRKETDMQKIRDQLQQAKQRSHDLEEELRGRSVAVTTFGPILRQIIVANTSAGRKNRSLETKLAENQRAVEEFRRERDGIAEDYAKLQRKFNESNKDADNLRQQLKSVQAIHDVKLHQLELQKAEIEDLRVVASGAEAAKAQRTQEQAAEGIVTLQEELRRLVKDAGDFARDLDDLRSERDALVARSEEEKVAADRTKVQAQSQIRLLKDRITELERKVGSAENAPAGHVCLSDEQALQALKAQHKNECKGLIVQIRYLKERVRREATMRSDLAYQKTWLLGIIAVMEQNEARILALIARVGYPKQKGEAERSRPTLKRVAYAVRFTIRIRRLSEAWRETSAAKHAIAAALDDVRRRRIVSNPVGGQ
ncbi:hypothetical protein M407DRAFT_226032 [Tulasnella calospora MUT 4182]|uniref:Pericentrin/AKAP-450 centrosomal targeting domain-containing protein n=1 Tax=Tulasnella calospora MUT 4182 TaxID=1051891 RepID=A0A0C3L7V5_9AGAM|nr:hypothetical protein M407DRAFT_226032 [Tulasnella calospora MUT 4182]